MKKRIEAVEKNVAATRRMPSGLSKLELVAQLGGKVYVPAIYRERRGIIDFLDEMVEREYGLETPNRNDDEIDRWGLRYGDVRLVYESAENHEGVGARPQLNDLNDDSRADERGGVSGANDAPSRRWFKYADGRTPGRRC